jgi:tetratricopeptide (TPR) repeat protein
MAATEAVYHRNGKMVYDQRKIPIIKRRRNMAQAKGFKWLSAVLVGIMVIFMSQCVPVEEQSQEEKLALQKAKRDSIRKANYNRCAFKLSNGNQYKIQENWNEALNNYKEVVSLGCAEDFVDPLFEDMAYCYFKLNQLDSAGWAIEEGLIYQPTDKHLLELSAYYNRNDVEESIRIYTKINSLYPGEPDYLFNLADYYGKANRFDEQIETLEQIMEVDPTNKKAEQTIVAAYESSGRDPIERIASLYDSNKSQYGYRYAKMLFDRGNYTEAQIVLEESIPLNSSNSALVDLLGQVYELENLLEKAIGLYKDIAARNPKEVSALIKVAELYKQIFDYRSALEWAEKAVNASGRSGRTLELRGDIYMSIADACSAGKPKGVDFNDKLIFHMAYEDFTEASKKGYSAVNTKIRFLKENELIIGSQKDYFLASEANKISTKEFKVLGECYSWITRTVKVQ